MNSGRHTFAIRWRPLFFYIMKVKNVKPHHSILLAAVTAIVILSCNETQQEDETAEPVTASRETVSPPQKIIPDKTVLVGEWTRTDAPYQIKITELLNDGTMKAGYFNPKSINVANATWVLANDVLKIFIELRDENYPGSNYNLIYYPEKNILAGKYFQAVEGITYDVGFTRAK